MGSSLRLGRFFGIELGINWSWLVIFVLIVWSLAAAIFPAQNPDLGDAAYVVMALVAALAFFTSLVAHEYGHALVARREGMEIEGITLWLFGGVARFKGMFPSAGAEFRIAIAGPLVSLTLGVLFVLLAVGAGLPEAADAVVAWLGYINLALLVFNLLPALPLDGGRILRSLLWQARGDFRWATTIAAGIGRGFGYLFIAGGILLFIVADSFSGAWLAFIGFFLLQAAGGEARYLATREALEGLRVRDLMVREPATVEADMTIGRAIDEVVWARRHTTYPVVENGAVVGLLPFRSVAAVPRSRWDTTTVRDCLVPLAEIPVLAEDDPAIDALVELGESTLNRGVVLDGTRLGGILSIVDLARALEAPPRRR
ncbi:MAG TPA: site-2 protease family protein [Gaiellaceae bacterium]|nr:site-2 protease family protein [Gaiellaceae bacterium]